MVVITNWTDARISWPRCTRFEDRSHPSLMPDDELARIAHTEAAAAVRYLRGVSHEFVEGWWNFRDVG